MKPNESANVGPLIGSIIIVLLLIVGGYYSLTSRPVKPEEPVLPVAPVEETVVVTPASTEVEDLSADAAAIDLTGVDAGITEVEAAVK